MNFSDCGEVGGRVQHEDLLLLCFTTSVAKELPMGRTPHDRNGVDVNESLFHSLNVYYLQ
ncbi:hypothetical protein Bpfe_015663, partial [Biomphalaria pfeifferi]